MPGTPDQGSSRWESLASRDVGVGSRALGSGFVLGFMAGDWWLFPTRALAVLDSIPRLFDAVLLLFPASSMSVLYTCFPLTFLSFDDSRKSNVQGD